MERDFPPLALSLAACALGIVASVAACACSVGWLAVLAERLLKERNT